MAKILEMQERRNRLFTEAQTLMSADNITAETRTKVKAIMSDVDVLEEDIKTQERLDKIETDLRSTERPPRPQPGSGSADKQHDEGVTRAFETYIRYGKDALTGEQRALLAERRDITTTGASGNTNGGFVIPQLFDTTLIEARKLVGNTVSIVGKKVTNNNGAPMKIATVNDTGNTLVTMTGEATLIGEADPSFNGFVLSTDTIATMVTMSYQELEDSAFDLNAWIRKQFGIRYYRGLETLITNGNGSNIASLKTGATAGVTASGTSALTNMNLQAGQVGPVFDDFVGMQGILDPAYEQGASWVMNSSTRAYLVGQKDNYGVPFWTRNPTTNVLDHILGRPIVLNQALPNAVNMSTTATATGILYGDFSEGYLLRTDGPISIRRSDDVLLQKLETVFVAYSRIGGAITDAGTHPILALTTPIA